MKTHKSNIAGGVKILNAFWTTGCIPRILGHFNTFTISSSVYHPTDWSADCVSFLVTVLFLYLMKRSCKEPGHYEQFHEKMGMIWRAGFNGYLFKEATWQQSTLYENFRMGLVKVARLEFPCHGQMVTISPLVMQPLRHIDLTIFLGFAQSAQLCFERIIFLITH